MVHLFPPCKQLYRLTLGEGLQISTIPVNESLYHMEIFDVVMSLRVGGGGGGGGGRRDVG